LTGLEDRARRISFVSRFKHFASFGRALQKIPFRLAALKIKSAFCSLKRRVQAARPGEGVVRPTPWQVLINSADDDLQATLA
jgi:hypothetical protein